MEDSDPRPMPPEVQRAYRDPLNLTDLLSSPVFTDRDRLAVRDELLERLVRKHGNVEVEVGNSAKLVPIRRRVSQFRKNIWVSIEIMVAAEELGGREAVMLELATVMQPYWLRWWDTMNWDSHASLHASLHISSSVLGSRQLAWLAAQYARSVVGLSSERQICLAAISSTETWAIVPSEENLKLARRDSEAAYSASERDYAASYADADAADRARSTAAANAASAAAHAAQVAVRSRFLSFDGSSSASRSTADSAAFAAGRANAVFVDDEDEEVITAAFNAAGSRLCELTKRLITPTLITSASRGLR